jgi:two-component system, LytTR family, sensor kinase
MANTTSSEAAARNPTVARRLWLVCGWLLTVLVFAGLWYAYDAGHQVSDPLIDYVGWSCYMWGVLTPIALWLAKRLPIDSRTWARAIPLHVAASILLAFVQLTLEAAAEWLRSRGGWPFAAVLRHYLTQHAQISIASYWLLIAGMQFYRLFDQGRRRELRAAQLEARLAEAQLEALRGQLQPHFLFNTLQAAVTLIHDDPEGAEAILLQLSELLRASLDKRHVQEIPLRRELELLDHYISIQKRRFGERLRFDLHIDPAALDCAVPTLIFQPLVENAVRHGVGKHREGDLVTIRAFREHDTLRLEIFNLTGALDCQPEQLFSRGVGLSNTRRRLEQLYAERQAFDIFNCRPRGVGVRLSMPAHAPISDESMLSMGVAS